MDELTQRCLDLPKKQKEHLIKVLQKSLEKKEDDGSRFRLLLETAESIVGEGILTASRNLNLVIGRRMIAHQMRREGYSISSIGKLMNRHHTSILHMLRMWDDAVAFQFKEEATFWKEFQTKLNEYETQLSSEMVRI